MQGCCWLLPVTFLGTGSVTHVPIPSPSILSTGEPICFPIGFPGGVVPWSPTAHLLGPLPPGVHLGWLPSLEFRWLLRCWRLRRPCQVCNIRTRVCHQVKSDPGCARVVHKKLRPVGLARSCSWPSRQTTTPSPSRRICAGIDVTPNSSIRAAPQRPMASACGIAIQGIV